jgi:alternate F1F0 ATPase F0 subunit B
MRIDWWTLALQAANFLVLVWLLQHFLYRPVLGIIAERQQRTDSVIAEANAAKSAAKQLRGELEQQRGAIARERDQALEEAHARATREASDLLERARTAAEQLLTEERRGIEQERAEAAEALRQQTIELGVAVARRLLAEAADGGLEAPFLGRALTKLQSLTEPERRELIAQLADGEAVRVMTARPLERAAIEALRQKLQELLGPGTSVQFANDPALIAGAELHFPHTILRHSWRDSLREIEQELKRDGRPQGLA